MDNSQENSEQLTPSSAEQTESLPNVPEPAPVAQAETPKTNNTPIIIATILFVLIAIVGVVAVVLITNQNNSSSNKQAENQNDSEPNNDTPQDIEEEQPQERQDRNQNEDNGSILTLEGDGFDVVYDSNIMEADEIAGTSYLFYIDSNDGFRHNMNFVSETIAGLESFDDFTCREYGEALVTETTGTYDGVPELSMAKSTTIGVDDYEACAVTLEGTISEYSIEQTQYLAIVDGVSYYFTISTTKNSPAIKDFNIVLETLVIN